MNLKNNKGYVGVDISIAVIILLIVVPTIMGIVFNINHTQNLVDIKSGAINIAVNAIEASKGIEVSELTADSIITNLRGNVYSGQIQDTTLNEDEAFNTEETTDANITVGAVAVITSKASYKLKITVTDYKKEDNHATSDIVKTVKATVIYKVGNTKESIDLSTVVK